MADELTFGALLRACREERGLSQEALAALLRDPDTAEGRRAGHSKVSEWERDAARPRNLEALATALGVKGRERDRFYRLAAKPTAPRERAQAPPG